VWCDFNERGGFEVFLIDQGSYVTTTDHTCMFWIAIATSQKLLDEVVK
jgi:hypothetical protein